VTGAVSTEPESFARIRAQIEELEQRRNNKTDIERAREKREAEAEERRLVPYRDRFGRFEDWADDAVQYLLDELSAGAFEADEIPAVFVAGIGIASAALKHRWSAALPPAVLNGIWFASDALIALHGDTLDERNRTAAETIWDLTCHTARPRARLVQAESVDGRGLRSELAGVGRH
jgi:hypothetical protein